ncbi:MAG: hypothetical protein PVG22_17430 [Chromatiales bacterium]|jgi:hypothetical protein
MKKNQRFTTLSLAALTLALSSGLVVADDDGYCMDVVIEPFHMMPDGSCAVKDYLDGELQDLFYPFTEEEHLFNCDYFGPATPLPGIGEVPSSVTGTISGTIDGYDFEATLLCASLTNWYQDSCSDPEDPNSCTFQLAQPMLKMGLPLPRLTEVSVFDGAIQVGKHKQIPIVMATRAAGIMHVEDLSAPLVGASITHSLLGLAILDDKDELKVLDASADMLLQGHIFFPGTVEEDVDPDTGANEAAVIKGSICSKPLYNKLNRRGGNKGKKGRDKD